MTHPPSQPLIVADIGGTNARFAMIGGAGAPITNLKSYRVEGFPSFDTALEAYLKEVRPSVTPALAIGAAGPVSDGRIELTNSAWEIVPAAIKRRFSLETAVLANDLVAMAAGIALAPASSLLDLPGGSRGALRRSLVIAIGTGLGVAWYEQRGNAIAVHSSEGGHMAFAPTSDVELTFVKRAIARREVLTFEDVISGSGIRAIYDRFCSSEPKLYETEAVFAAADAKNNSAAEATIGLAVYSLSTFARSLVAVLGGVDQIVIAGGIGRRLREYLGSDFLARLRADREIPLDLSRIAVRVALDDTLPLTGAANLAYGLAELGKPETDRSP